MSLWNFGSRGLLLHVLPYTKLRLPCVFKPNSLAAFQMRANKWEKNFTLKCFYQKQYVVTILKCSTDLRADYVTGVRDDLS